MKGNAVTAPSFPIRSLAAAFLAVLVGVGLSRFAYNPLMPATILAGWFSPSHAMYFAVANLAGYLLGALTAPKLATLVAPHKLLRLSMLVAAAVFFCSTTPLSFTWFFTLRFVSGVVGAFAMVLSALTVLPLIRERYQGVASGIIFAGVGLGIVVSGSLIPYLLTSGLASTWAYLGAIALVACLFSWSWWPQAVSTTPPIAAEVRRHSLPERSFSATFTVYSLVSCALVGHMIFLVDFLSRGLGHSIQVGSTLLIVFGIGAVGGPIVAGRMSDAVGIIATTRLMIVLCIPSIGVLAMDASLIGIALSCLVTGSAVTAIPSVVLGRIKELTRSPIRRRQAWATATACYAIAQTTTSFFLAETLRFSGERYDLLFLICTALMGIALAIQLLADHPRRHRLPCEGP
ncbi:MULTISPECIES: YbfB/YjiJ family MFS transporter [unclassified Halomonas]|uniref:YbfB/YjiJ family MFS transporter n=1 Tax=unclassified Halomonas TaxID=2609666 RepID=UPI002580453B|nr:YbfB/YjiJ family MFS transporter [Halomonas sp.]MCJ8284443.1 MFS transporter [Halomonas sp.]NQY69497.1 YbfB/YjiJ family MFS transporter [Halomonas sp.]